MKVNIPLRRHFSDCNTFKKDIVADKEGGGLLYPQEGRKARRKPRSAGPGTRLTRSFKLCIDRGLRSHILSRDTIAQATVCNLALLECETMEAPSSPREASPAVAVLAVPTNPASKKRKHAAISGGLAASPAPSERGGTPNPANENVVIATRQLDLASRPRLTISRHPSFVPVAPNSLYHSTEPLCFNRLNFRYTPAGLSDPTSTHPFRTIESSPTAFRVSWEDRSPFVKVTLDGLGLRGEKGFRSARCNAPVREGKWYMEVKIGLGGGDSVPDAKKKEGSHVRLGWARREAPLGGPAGLDGYSYAVRDKTGEKVHLSRSRPYGRPFKSGDVVGMYISLPSPRRQPNKKDPHDPAHIKRERIAIEFKGQEYFESLEYSQSKEMLALMEANNRSKVSSSAPAPPPTKKSATVKNLPSTSRGGKAAPPEPAPMRPLPTLGPESCIAFFVNGEPQGIAFQDLYDYLPLRAGPNKAQEKKRAHKEGIREHKENPFDDGSLGYYPVISLFNEAEVRINPGPNFDFPPPADIDAVLMSESGVDSDIKPTLDGGPMWRPMCERYPEYMSEQFALDNQEESDANAHQKASDAKDQNEKVKQEMHRAKRRAQAARRREKKMKEKEGADVAAAPLRDSAVPAQLLPEESRDPSMEVDNATIEESRYSSPGVQALDPYPAEGAQLVGPGLGHEFTPPLAAGSIGDVQSYWLGAAAGDTSGYNTEYEDAVADTESQGPDIRFEDELMHNS
ncbi:hypothetical protein BDW22DRAFT_1421891 [Trametopsis cervina]|nr:hypothetical protein BDW22DRAFT_1421891 [Trametopsis cervina]